MNIYAMSETLLATKMYAPPVREGLIRRTQLLKRFHAGQLGKLVLISAPAGYGKTTLVSSWIKEQDTPIAWLSLDENDKDPFRLLKYLITAVQKVQLDFGQSILLALNGPTQLDLDTILTELINELQIMERRITLVLDDLHSAQTDITTQLLQKLIDYLPSTILVVITTREETSLALAKLRAKGKLTEFRLHDLRFDEVETEQFLHQTMQLTLPINSVLALGDATEGWVTGLQLAALSLYGKTSSADFFEHFETGQRFIAEYLFEDVFQKQPIHIQNFLLKTALLERFCAPLCDAISSFNNTNSQDDLPSLTTLEFIYQKNLFIVPLDSEGKWYRYHHLFRDFLESRMLSQSPEAVNPLHLSASYWFLEEGLEIEAFTHAAAANDYELALRIINSGLVPLNFRGGVAQIIQWLNTVTVDAMDQHPDLWVTWASSLLALGLIDGITEKLAASEKALANPPKKYADPEIFGRIASIRASVAVTKHDHETILEQAGIAQKHLKPDNKAARASIAWATGYAHSLRHETTLAENAYSECLTVCDQIGFTIIGNMCRLGLSKLWLDRLELLKVEAICQEFIDHAGTYPPPTTCDAYLALGMVHYQWNNLEKAYQFAQQSLFMARKILNTDRAVNCELFLAQIALAKGKISAAEEQLVCIEEAIQLNGYHLQFEYLCSLRAQLALLRKDFNQAAYWSNQHPKAHYRILVCLAEGNIAEAMRLSKANSDQHNSVQEQVQFYLTQALIELALENKTFAKAHVEKAIQLSKPGNAIRLFLDSGPEILDLLKLEFSNKVNPAFVQSILQRTTQGHDSSSHRDSHTNTTHQLQNSESANSISKRELEILKLIAEGLSNQEISERLHRALSTIKGHNKSIFEKLKVQRRTEAIAKARDLGLI